MCPVYGNKRHARKDQTHSGCWKKHMIDSLVFVFIQIIGRCFCRLSCGIVPVVIPFARQQGACKRSGCRCLMGHILVQVHYHVVESLDLTERIWTLNICIFEINPFKVLTANSDRLNDLSSKSNRNKHATNIEHHNRGKGSALWESRLYNHVSFFK